MEQVEDCKEQFHNHSQEKYFKGTENEPGFISKLEMFHLRIQTQTRCNKCKVLTCDLAQHQIKLFWKEISTEKSSHEQPKRVSRKK